MHLGSDGVAWCALEGVETVDNKDEVTCEQCLKILKQWESINK